MADKKRLLTMIELKKPVSQMTEEELNELARHVVARVREKVPKPPKPPKKS